MLEKSLEIIFAVVGSLWLSISLISSFNSYKYVKKNFRSISKFLFGDPQYLKKIDWSNHLLIEMVVGAIAALRFRELKILKRDSVFSKGHLPFAPNLNDNNLNLFLRDHGEWYKSVTRNILFTFSCLFVLAIILIFFELKN